MKIYIAFVIYLVIAVSSFGRDGHDMIKTPHGYRPKKCVHRHAEDVIISELKDGSGTNIFYPSSHHSSVIPRDDDCIADALELKKQMLSSRSRQSIYKQNIQNLEAWEDYAFYASSVSMANFTAKYVIPEESPFGIAQLLYYFIGFENLDEGTLSIVQPVVNYDHSGQYVRGWSMEPWNCCPSGQSHSGKNIVMAEGESALAWIYTTDDRVVIGQSKLSNSSASSVMTVLLEKRVWDWACATLEDYSATCNDTTSLPFDCKNMELTSMAGDNVTPEWSGTGQNVCDGGVVIHSSSYISIYGHDIP